MDVRVGPELAQVQSSRPDRRDLAADARHDRPLPPAVLVEIGRPEEHAGTYSARGVLEGATMAKTGEPAAAAKAVMIAEEPSFRVNAHAEAAASAGGHMGAPEAMALKGNAHVQAMVGSSPELAASLRTRGAPLEAPASHLPHGHHTALAPIATLDVNALQQAEKGEAPAQHEDEADALRKEKDPRGGKDRRPRR